MYIVFEGIDGSGKTTQTAILCEQLFKLGYTGIRLAEPTYGKYGLKIREQMSRGKDKGNKTQHELFTQDRRQHVKIKIKPILIFIKENPSFVVVQDRSFLSAPAYQADGEVDMLNVLKDQLEFSPQPDIIFLLDIPADVALKRKKALKKPLSLFETPEKLEKVRQSYLFLASKGAKDIKYIKIIDGSDPIDTISKKILEVLSLNPISL